MWKRRSVEISCVKETRLRGKSVGTISRNVAQHKAILSWKLQCHVGSLAEFFDLCSYEHNSREHTLQGEVK